ncbi:PREDICTED: carbonic anhydrase-related protein [Pygoscelis adeliae]|uniref:carbonic anhydrase-related protein n=1 Tax=Pygoscelis adeliae TaxID=9238 RepID=UPI0004F4F03C|nr:PREDICTED: carbonic anhydrase-related protein [Pygoscelis adeliae]
MPEVKQRWQEACMDEQEALDKTQREKKKHSRGGSKTELQESQAPETHRNIWNKEELPLLEEDQVREHLNNLDTHKSMGPDGMQVQVLRELANVTARPLSIIFERSRQSGKFPEDWKKVLLSSRRDYRPVSLTSVLGEEMEQIILDAIWVEWGLIFPDANGEYQSPINLNSREAKYDPSLLEVRLSPNYVVCRDCEVINDGHSIQIALKSKSVLIGGPLPRGHEFELHDVRFHWGRENQRGSEHTVNFKAFPMELHLMHWNSTLYSSIDEAVGKKHGIAIIALFVQIGKEHVGLKAVTEILQDIQYKGKSKTIPCFNPNSLLPDPLLRDYWVYEGSLTIPPCSEGVTWILFRYPLTVSQVQIEEFRRLRTHVKGAELLEGCDGILGDNFRPTQPLSDRVIRAAFQ